MLTITNKQLAVLQQNSTNKFVQNCHVFLSQNFKTWYDNKNKEEVNRYVFDFIEFGTKYKIKKDINIQKLMMMHLKYDVEFLSEAFLQNHALKEIICFPDRKEDHKVEYLIAEIKESL